MTPNFFSKIYFATLRRVLDLAPPTYRVSVSGAKWCVLYSPLLLRRHSPNPKRKPFFASKLVVNAPEVPLTKKKGRRIGKERNTHTHTHTHTHSS